MFLSELQEEKSQALALQYEATEIKEIHQQEKSERNKMQKHYLRRKMKHFIIKSLPDSHLVLG